LSSHVEKVLNEVEGVKNASVNLEKAEAEVEMERHIKTEEFQRALKADGGNYSITDYSEAAPSAGSSQENKSMVHKYSVSGMTCNGCRSHVEKVLNEVEGVKMLRLILKRLKLKLKWKGISKLKNFRRPWRKMVGTIVFQIILKQRLQLRTHLKINRWSISIPSQG
jgi:P-type Cu+ transporter